MNVDKTSPITTPGSTPGPSVTCAVTCAECCAQLPPVAASNFEMEDYVLHFCSAQCYQMWHAKGMQVVAGSERPT